MSPVEFVARTFEKTDYSSPRRFIWSHIRRHPWLVMGVLLGAFSNAALASLASIIVGRAVDAIVEREDVAYVGLMALALVGSQSIRAGLQFVRNASTEVFAQRIERDVRDELYVSLLGKSMTFHDFQPVLAGQPNQVLYGEGASGQGVQQGVFQILIKSSDLFPPANTFDDFHGQIPPFLHYLFQFFHFHRLNPGVCGRAVQGIEVYAVRLNSPDDPMESRQFPCVIIDGFHHEDFQPELPFVDPAESDEAFDDFFSFIPILQTSKCLIDNP